MTITIKCECGNEVKMSAPPKKYLQMTDNMKGFFHDGVKIKDGKLEEFCIQCKCGNFIYLGMD